MKWLLIILAAIAVVGAGIWLTDPFATEIPVSEARTGTAVNAVSGHVTVKASFKADVRSQTDGDVIEVIKPPKSAARRVEKGDPIVRLDTKEIDIEIRIARADYEQAKALLEAESQLIPVIEGIEKELADQEVLLEAGKLAPNVVENTRRNLRRHRNLLEAETINHQRLYDRNKAQLDRLLLRREEMTIRTPVSGTLDGILVYVGEPIRNNTKVAEVVSESRFVSIDVAEEDLDGIEIGMPVTVRLLAYGNRLFQGEVSWLAPTADEDTKRRNVAIGLDIDEDLLVPGLTGQASIIKGERENALLVPRRALVGNRLYVVNNGVVEIREVELGYLSAGSAEVLSGIEPGEAVIVETPHIFNDGDKVKISEMIPF